MRPLRIILVRHGQSEGNVDKTVYFQKPDYAIRLTEKGKAQAHVAGKELKGIIGGQSVFAYVSPFTRTKETFLEIIKPFGKVEYREDPRIREQEWFTRMQGYDASQEQGRKDYGHFYYRFQGGESCADCYDRVSSFLDTLHRDFEKDSFAENCLIVTHGMLMRVFMMRWLHLTVEEFEMLANPKNAEYIILERQHAHHYYRLRYPLRKYDAADHNYQFKLEERILEM